MVDLKLNEHSHEDFLHIQELQKEGVPDEIIQLAYENTLKARETDRELYEKTMKRLNRIGAKTPTEQIISLAKEIEYYRNKIQRMQESFLSKNDAIREFAKQHKEIMREYLYNGGTDFLMKWCEYETSTDNLVKEMTEDSGNV